MTNYEMICNAFAFIIDSRKESNISRLQIETLDENSIIEFGEDFDFDIDSFNIALGMIDDAIKNY